MKQIKIFLGLILLVVLVSCNDESYYYNSSRHVVITAELPDAHQTRACLIQKEGSLDMIAQFKDDKISVLAEQDGKTYKINGSDFWGNIPLVISENKKSCTFEFDLREEIDPNRPYKLHGVNSVMTTVIGTISDEESAATAVGSLYREEGLNGVPLYFEVEDGRDISKVEFKHFTAYEILHVTNISDEPIVFQYGGYEADELWYYYCYQIIFHNGVEIFGNDNYQGNGYGSQTVIAPGETKDFLSCYIPTGKKMVNAKLRASVNGNEIYSSNTKSSDVDIKVGNAYHLYATWNGKELKFKENGNVEIPTEGLVAYYPFNGNANDASGYGNHGTPSSNVSLTTGVNGEYNGAYLFGGVDKPGSIHVKNSESLKFSDGCTFAAFIKPVSWRSMDGWGSTVNTGGGQCFMAKNHDVSGVTFMLSGNDEKCVVSMKSYQNREPWATASSGNKLIGNYLNLWTHVAFVYGNGRARLYVNGELMCDNESNPNFSTMNSRDFYIGKFSDYWYPFNGAIDEVRIYDRPLSESEIKALARHDEDTGSGMPSDDGTVIDDDSPEDPFGDD